MLLGWNIGRPLHSSGLFQLCNVLRQLITYWSWSGIWNKTAEMQKTRRILRLTLQFRPIWFGLHLPITDKEILHLLQVLQIPSPKIESGGDQVMPFLHSLIKRNAQCPNCSKICQFFLPNNWLIFETFQFKSQNTIQEIFGESVNPGESYPRPKMHRYSSTVSDCLNKNLVSSKNLRNFSQSANPWERANPWKN